jgi:hypothetical protein
MLLRAVVLALLAALGVAQSDRVQLDGGELLTDVELTSFDLRHLHYRKGGDAATVSAERVIGIESARAIALCSRAIGAHDGAELLAMARAQWQAKDAMQAQQITVLLAKLWLLEGKDSSVVSLFTELQAQAPDAGVLPQLLRMRVDHGLLTGSAAGFAAASSAVHCWQQETGWPLALRFEGELLFALVSLQSAGDCKAALALLQELAPRAEAFGKPFAARTQAVLLEALARTGDGAATQNQWQALAEDQADAFARAFALLQLGRQELAVAQTTPEDRASARRALRLFLRVAIECEAAPDFLLADALFFGAKSAELGGGVDSHAVAARCKSELRARFADSKRARQLSPP